MIFSIKIIQDSKVIITSQRRHRPGHSGCGDLASVSPQGVPVGFWCPDGMGNGDGLAKKT